MEASLLDRAQTSPAAKENEPAGESLVDFQQRIYDRLESAERESRSRVASALFIVVSAGEQKFAIRSEDVKTIVEVPDIAPIPVLAQAILGLIQVGGSVYALRDVASTFGKAKVPSLTYTARVICLAQHVDSGLALLVTRVDSSCDETDLPNDVIRLSADILKNPKI